MSIGCPAQVLMAPSGSPAGIRLGRSVSGRSGWNYVGTCNARCGGKKQVQITWQNPSKLGGFAFSRVCARQEIICVNSKSMNLLSNRYGGKKKQKELCGHADMPVSYTLSD